jgi:hypothetical protein
MSNGVKEDIAVVIIPLSGRQLGWLGNQRSERHQPNVTPMLGALRILRQSATRNNCDKSSFYLKLAI